MKKDIKEIIEIPEDIELEITNQTIITRGNSLENKKNFDARNIKITKHKNQIILDAKKATKKEKKKMMTIKAHIKNMIMGLQKKFTYKLEICNVHFPMNVSYDKEKGKLIIKNFLGETHSRIVNIKPQVEIKIEGHIITIESHNKELAGQTAANIEKATKLKGKDRRIFQDGIFIIEKSGKKI